MTFSVAFAGLKPSTCTTANFTLTGAADGHTLALGIPNAMMTVAGIPKLFRLGERGQHRHNPAM